MSKIKWPSLIRSRRLVKLNISVLSAILGSILCPDYVWILKILESNGCSFAELVETWHGKHIFTHPSLIIRLLFDEDRYHRLFDYSRMSKTLILYNWIDTKYKILDILKKSILKFFRIFWIWPIVQEISQIQVIKNISLLSLASCQISNQSLYYKNFYEFRSKFLRWV